MNHSKHFIMKEIIDSGSFGTVYRARYLKNNINKDNAVKIMPLKRDDINDIKNREIIHRELKNWQKVSGLPNILKLEAYEIDNNTLFFISEYCSKGTLAKFNKIYDFSEVEIKNIIKSILTGIKGCHDNNIAHCDIKPYNILLSDDDQWILCDFGNSKINRNEYSGLFTHSGTPFYMSPEIFNRLEYGNNVDIWAIGVLTFNLYFKGFHPFPNNLSDRGTKNIYFEKGIKWELDHALDISKEIKDFIEKCLELDKTKRLTAEEALNHPFLL